MPKLPEKRSTWASSPLDFPTCQWLESPANTGRSCRFGGLPEVAEAFSLAVALWCPASEPGAGPGRTVSDHKRDDLPGPTVQSNPQPPFIRPLPGASPPVHRVQGHHLPQQASSPRLLARLLVLFPSHRFNATATDSKNAADCALRSAFAVSTEDLLFFLLRVAPRFWINHLMRTTVLAVILLAATGAVPVFRQDKRSRTPCTRESL